MTHRLFVEIERGSKSVLTKKRIINYYMYHRSSTIPDLSKELDLSVPTVTKFITEMCEDGYLTGYGKLETNEGRPPSLYGLNPESGYFVGVDIKKSSATMALMNFTGDMIGMKQDIPYRFENTPGGLERLCSSIDSFIGGLSVAKEKILSVGFNISGRVNPELGYSYSLFNFEERPLCKVLSDRLDLPVSVDNDTRAMAYGELAKGAMKGAKHAVFVNVSWGLGTGLLVDGKIVKGKSGFAGELGHMNVFDNEIICHCGKRGCLETEVSGMALHRRLLECIKEGKSCVLAERVLSDKIPLTLSDIIDATNKEDLLCIELVEEIGQKLGRYLAGIINLLNPELVVLGGSLSLTGDYLLQPVRSAVRKYSLNMVNKDSSVVLSRLGDEAGVIGACMLTRNRLFEN